MYSHFFNYLFSLYYISISVLLHLIEKSGDITTVVSIVASQNSEKSFNLVATVKFIHCVLETGVRVSSLPLYFE